MTSPSTITSGGARPGVVVRAHCHAVAPADMIAASRSPGASARWRPWPRKSPDSQTRPTISQARAVPLCGATGRMSPPRRRAPGGQGRSLLRRRWRNLASPGLEISNLRQQQAALLTRRRARFENHLEPMAGKFGEQAAGSWRRSVPYRRRCSGMSEAAARRCGAGGCLRSKAAIDEQQYLCRALRRRARVEQLRSDVISRCRLSRYPASPLRGRQSASASVATELVLLQSGRHVVGFCVDIGIHAVRLGAFMPTLPATASRRSSSGAIRC